MTAIVLRDSGDLVKRQRMKMLQAPVQATEDAPQPDKNNREWNEKGIKLDGKSGGGGAGRKSKDKTGKK